MTAFTIDHLWPDSLQCNRFLLQILCGSHFSKNEFNVQDISDCHLYFLINNSTRLILFETTEWWRLRTRYYCTSVPLERFKNFLWCIRVILEKCGFSMQMVRCSRSTERCYRGNCESVSHTTQNTRKIAKRRSVCGLFFVCRYLLGYLLRYFENKWMFIHLNIQTYASHFNFWVLLFHHQLMNVEWLASSYEACRSEESSCLVARWALVRKFPANRQVHINFSGTCEDIEKKVYCMSSEIDKRWDTSWKRRSVDFWR